MFISEQVHSEATLIFNLLIIISNHFEFDDMLDPQFSLAPKSVADNLSQLQSKLWLWTIRMTTLTNENCHMFIFGCSILVQHFKKQHYEATSAKIHFLLSFT